MLQLATFDLPDYDIEMVRYMQNQDGPVALFSYRDSGGGPATLAIQPHSPDEPPHDLSIDHGLYGSIAYWSDDDVDYTIIASHRIASHRIASHRSIMTRSCPCLPQSGRLRPHSPGSRRAGC